MGVPKCHVPGVPRVEVSRCGGPQVPCHSVPGAGGSPVNWGALGVGVPGLGVPRMQESPDAGILGYHILCVPRGGGGGVPHVPRSCVPDYGGVPGWGCHRCPCVPRLPTRAATGEDPHAAATQGVPEGWGPPKAPQPRPACAAFPTGAGHPWGEGHPWGWHPRRGVPIGGSWGGHPCWGQ